MTNLGIAGEEEAKRKGWKKVFGGTIKGGKRMDREKSGKKKADVPSRVRWGRDPVVNTNGNGSVNAGGKSGGGSAGKGGDEGFVGMGKDGVWISRKNFLKT